MNTAPKLLEKLPSLATLDAVDDDERSGRRPCPLNNFTIADVRTLHAALAPPSGDGVDAMVERLAKFIYRKESLNCKTIDEAMHHQSNWRRAIPEAREMLEAAIGSNLFAFFDIGGNSK